MAKRRKKKIVRLIHLSAGPLPSRIASLYADLPLVFSDASLKRQGGIAAVLFATADSPPMIASQSQPLTGSNELELQASLFAMQQAAQHFPGLAFALFSDNQDAIERLQQAQNSSLEDDSALSALLCAHELHDVLQRVQFRWIKGHATCRGNHLADQHARQAAIHHAAS